MKNSSAWVHRPDLSGYLSDGYLKLEEEALLASGVTRYTFGALPANDASPDIVVTSSNTSIQQLAESGLFKNTRLIIHPNSGYDNFSVDFVRKFKGEIILGNTLRARAVADYILKGVVTYATAALPKTESWDQKRSFPRQLLQSKKALVIGLGYIGKLVRAGLESFGTKVFVYDPFQGESKLPNLGEIQIVCLCASLNPSSKNLINQIFLEQLPNDFLLINAARGGLVDLKALIQTLKKKPKSFALLDVFPEEPFAIESFKDLHNLHCTSHIAGVYDQLSEQMIKFITEVASGTQTKYPRLKDRLIDNVLL